jgi:hypothetical protein
MQLHLRAAGDANAARQPQCQKMYAQRFCHHVPLPEPAQYGILLVSAIYASGKQQMRAEDIIVYS